VATAEDDRKPGWWDACIGPGKPIDTRRFFVVSVNNPGGCHGSTGPATENPATGKPWGPDFPQPQVEDWVDAQARLADHLGIDCWAAVIGGSLGGMQAMSWSLRYPERLRYCVVIAAALKLSAQNIAFNEIARRAIITTRALPTVTTWKRARDPPRAWPWRAWSVTSPTCPTTPWPTASAASCRNRPPMPLAGDSQFQVESYLRYQGAQFSTVFDANTYLLMTRALDLFDLAADDDGDASRPSDAPAATSWCCPSPRTGASRRRARGRSSTRWSPPSARSATPRSTPPRATTPSCCPSRATCRSCDAYLQRIAT
jgi:homoserine O-acetyltransferase